MEGTSNKAKRSGEFHSTLHFNTLAGVYFSTPACVGREGVCGEEHTQLLSTLMYLRENIVFLVWLSVGERGTGWVEARLPSRAALPKRRGQWCWGMAGQHQCIATMQPSFGTSVGLCPGLSPSFDVFCPPGSM